MVCAPSLRASVCNIAFSQKLTAKFDEEVCEIECEGWSQGLKYCDCHCHLDVLTNATFMEMCFVRSSDEMEIERKFSELINLLREEGSVSMGLMLWLRGGSDDLSEKLLSPKQSSWRKGY